ncbi:hypothetical protein ScPMuIL_003453 [Solemya velum]
MISPRARVEIQKSDRKMSSTLFAKVAFYPSLFYQVVMNKMTTRRWYDRVDDSVLLGALPFRSMTKQLVEEEHVRGVVDLTEGFETAQFSNSPKDWQDWGVEHLHIPTVDFVSSPLQGDIEKAVDFILQHRKEKSSVYVHCKAGRTRSATVVACYLIKLNGWSPEQSVEFLQTKRPHIWLREKQMQSIQQYFDTTNKGGHFKGG